MDELEEGFDDLLFDKGPRIRSLMDELSEREGAEPLTWQQLLESVLWDAGRGAGGAAGSGDPR